MNTLSERDEPAPSSESLAALEWILRTALNPSVVDVTASDL